MNRDALYEQVARELQAQQIVPGIWTRAFAETDGQLDRARALYIKYRVAQLAETEAEQAKKGRRLVADAARKRAQAGVRGTIFLALALLGALLTLLLPMFAMFTLLGESNDKAVLVPGLLGLSIVLGFATVMALKAYRTESYLSAANPGRHHR
jgi:hypothetical protein